MEQFVAAAARRRFGEKLHRVQRRSHAYRINSQIGVFDVETCDGDRRWIGKRVFDGSDSPLYGPARRRLAAEQGALHQLSSTDGAVRVPCPVEFDVEQGMLVMEHIPGFSMESLWSTLHVESLGRDVERLCESLRSIAKWLSGWQRDHGASTATTQWWGDLQKHIRVRLSNIARAATANETARLEAAVAERVDCLREDGPPELPLFPCHGDLGPWNILIDDVNVAVIDFSCTRLQVAAYDLVGLLVFLQDESVGWRHRKKRLVRLQDALRQNYHAPAPVPPSVLVVVELLHRLCRIEDGCRHRRHGTWYARRRAHRAIAQHLAWIEHPEHIPIFSVGRESPPSV